VTLVLCLPAAQSSAARLSMRRRLDCFFGRRRQKALP
jgi:hypothetical protein